MTEEDIKSAKRRVRDFLEEDDTLTTFIEEWASQDDEVSVSAPLETRDFISQEEEEEECSSTAPATTAVPASEELECAQKLQMYFKSKGNMLEDMQLQTWMQALKKDLHQGLCQTKIADMFKKC